MLNNDRSQGAQWWFESKDDQCETRYFVELFYTSNVPENLI